MAERAPFRPREAYRTWRTISTRWMDNDAYGHVNNTVYYSWFDTVVNGYLVDAGVLDIATSPTICVVVETGCRYAQSVTFPQGVEAGIRVVHTGLSSVRYEVGLFIAGTRTAAAEGYFVHVHVDRESRRPLAFTPQWRSALIAISV
ncbi:acyl-CoA thioesterase [Polymorphobacter sp. PAMC 29334]|uniref:acyl-CoA thioesterase n=1 Tax=Polymorphobacter sp. PAMC 29334 TaxID=2862331 RepID=UPI001C67CE31|nr:thioesterase family protein [Polymorphobacter sp. PAMC 29334]QYE34911.1 acyl-CoA thioesterase [Polymorphobacter sp. PAMC 29334]